MRMCFVLVLLTIFAAGPANAAASGYCDPNASPVSCIDASCDTDLPHQNKNVISLDRASSKPVICKFDNIKNGYFWIVMGAANERDAPDGPPGTHCGAWTTMSGTDRDLNELSPNPKCIAPCKGVCKACPRGYDDIIISRFPDSSVLTGEYSQTFWHNVTETHVCVKK